METLIVTGGAGFIGSALVRRLLADPTPPRVVVFDKLTYAGSRLNLREIEDHAGFAFVEADVADREAVRETIAETAPNAILHLAAETHVDRSIDAPERFLQTNIRGTFELLEASREYLSANPARRDSFRFLHVSTDEVYGSLADTGRFREDSPYAPSSPYAASKAAADHLVRAYHRTYGLPVLLSNCSNNYGPRQYPEKLVPLALLNMCEGLPVPLYGDGRQVRDWLFVEDHCDGLVRVLRRGRVGESYNLGGGTEVTNSDLVDLLAEVLEEMLPARENAALEGRCDSYPELKTLVQDRPGHDRRYAMDTEKIRREVGWRPSTELRQGLRATVEWFLANRDWCREIQTHGHARERQGLPEPR